MQILLIAAIAVGVACGRAAAQDIPRFQILSKDDLLAALAADGRSHIWREFPRAAIIALEGRRILPWLIEIVRDPEISTRLGARAIQVMGFARDSAAVPFLLSVFREEGYVLRTRAREALRLLPDERVCEVWRGLLSDPISNSRDVDDAVVGLGHCGREDDIDLLVGLGQRTGATVYTREYIQRAVRQIRAGPAEQLRGFYFGGPPSGDGRYVPSDSAAAAMRQAVCGVVTCPIDFIPPSTALRARD